MEVVQQSARTPTIRPRRPDLQDQERQRRLLRQRELLRLGHRRAPGGHQSRRLRPPGRHAKLATLGDEPSSTTCSFNAGLDSGSSYEWTDENNRLHFYVVDKTTDASGILHYKVAVKSLDGAGPQTRGVALQAAGSTEVAAGQWSTCTFPLKNTGAAARRPRPAPAGRDRVPHQRRLPSRGFGHGHRMERQGAQRAHRRKFGDTVKVPVYVTKATGAAADGQSR